MRPVLDWCTVRGDDLLDVVPLMLRRPPAGGYGDNVASAEGTVRVVDEVVLRVGEELLSPLGQRRV